MKKVWSFFLDILFPPRCLACRRHLPAGTVCETCFRNIPVHTAFFCGACGARLPLGQKVCHPAHPYLLGAAADYAHPAVAALVKGLKFEGIRDAATPLSELLAAYARALGYQPAPETLIVPLPLSRRRERERGYNQAHLLAKSFAASFSMPVDAALVRVQHSPPQSTRATAAERTGNVAGAFRAEARVRNKQVWLVDDVTTSGSTLREASAALRAQGARQIIAWVVAKA